MVLDFSGLRSMVSERGDLREKDEVRVHCVVKTKSSSSAATIIRPLTAIGV